MLEWEKENINFQGIPSNLYEFPFILFQNVEDNGINNKTDVIDYVINVV